MFFSSGYMHASGTSREITVADRISDISLISTACLKHLPQYDLRHQYGTVNSSACSLAAIQIMDLISVSIIHRKNGLHHDCWSQQAALASIYLQGHGRITGVKGTSESITDHFSPYKLRNQYDHELHSRLFWLRDNRHQRTLQRPH